MRAALGLGSNMGDRARHLRRALDGLRGLGEVTAVSRFHETEPLGGPPQGAYLNAAVLLDTALDAHALHDATLRLERQAGRTRTERWGPRTLDIDLLLLDDLRIDEPGLAIPHPRLAERLFVLAPLREIAPDWVVPGLGLSVESLHADLQERR